MTPEKRKLLKEQLTMAIEPFIDNSFGYGMVAYSDAKRLLGDSEWMELLPGNAIYRQAPKGLGGNWFYWWNVVDVMIEAAERRESK